MLCTFCQFELDLNGLFFTLKRYYIYSNDYFYGRNYLLLENSRRCV